MRLTAKIPDIVVFNVEQPAKDEYFVTNTNWFDLPEKNRHQKDVQKNQVETKPAHPFVLQTKKELKKYIDDPKFFIHENTPVKIKLAGYQDQGSNSQIRLEPIVQLPSGHSVTMQQDILINALLDGGIGNKGRLPGEYLFACINRRVKLIRAESSLHRAVKHHLKKRARKPLSVKEMTVGKVYRSAAGNTGLFLGFVSTETMIVDLPEGVRHYYRPGSNYPNMDFGVRFRPQELASLWFTYQVERFGKATSSEELMERLLGAVSGDNMYNISANKSHSYVEEVPGYHLDFPFDIVTHIRATAVRKAAKALERSRLRRTNPGVNYRDLDDPKKTLNKPDVIRHYDAYAIEHYSSLANMSLFGTGVIRSDPFKRFEPWETKTNKFKKKKT